MALKLHVIESICIAGGGSVNDDRIGQAGSLAWVLDGSTDVGERRLLPGESDAAWLAETLHRALRQAAQKPVPQLPELVRQLTHGARQAFDREALHPVREPHEQPAAAGIVAHLDGGHLHTASLADCQLIAWAPGGPVQLLGADPKEGAGDKRVAEAVRKLSRPAAPTSKGLSREGLLPKLRAARARMNRPDGYGVFSLTEPPPRFLRLESVPAPAGTRLLLASDGFTRLSDVFGRYPLEGLLELSFAHGLEALVRELRALEAADADCSLYPRAKREDDVSAILIEVIAGESGHESALNDGIGAA